MDKCRLVNYIKSYCFISDINNIIVRPFAKQKQNYHFEGTFL